eukprot:scaffold19091_cov107-Amphora_coffeaeformis.AAC.1
MVRHISQPFHLGRKDTLRTWEVIHHLPVFIEKYDTGSAGIIPMFFVFDRSHVSCDMLVGSIKQ